MRAKSSKDERLLRIRAEIAARAEIRRKRIQELIELHFDDACDSEVSALHQIGDAWLLFESEIPQVLLSALDCRSSMALAARVWELETIDTALADTLGEEQLTKIRWLRSPSSSLEGFRPLEYIQGSRGDSKRILRAIQIDKDKR